VSPAWKSHPGGSKGLHREPDLAAVVGATCQPWHSSGVRWNDEKSLRFQALRAAEARGTLTDPERVELSRLLEDLDADEADALRPAMEQAAARAENLAASMAQLEAQAAALARIVAEQEGLLADATAYLLKLREKSAALTEDYRRLMGHDLAAVR
jgi:hypothetical protein